MTTTLSAMRLSQDNHIVLARQLAREIAALLGFESHDQTRIATAVSEVARDALNHAGAGEVEFRVEKSEHDQLLVIDVKSRSGIIPDATGSSKRQDVSPSGFSGMAAARRLMDQLHVQHGSDGRTTVRLRKKIPVSNDGLRLDLNWISSEISSRIPRDPIEEIRQQNLELVSVLEELRNRQEELTSLNQELEDTNRGVVALYAELEQRAEYLKKSHENKSRYLSEMGHELRTPINAILAISQILLERTDGDLTDEQEKQLGLIKQSSQNLSQLVNDLLDLSKIEAGKTQVEAVDFDVQKLFGTLKSMLKPLLHGAQVDLVFEDPIGIPAIFSDEGKVSQVLRNLIANAIKFTEQGEVRVSTVSLLKGEVVFYVRDTGIGIAPEYQELIFEEFAQVKNPLQNRHKGTGLGLPLSRKLAELLGGTVSCESQPGIGSTFIFTLPVRYSQAGHARGAGVKGKEFDPMRHTVLIIEDDPEVVSAYEEYLRGSAFQVTHVSTVAQARVFLQNHKPMAIVLDILLPCEDGWTFIPEIKNNPATENIPILVCTVVDEPDKAIVLGAEDFCSKPVSGNWLLGKLKSLAPIKKILVVDDDVTSRYVLKRLLGGTVYEIIEASDGEEGISQAYSERPDIIFLDLVMPRMNGFETLRRIKSDPQISSIPVIIVTSKDLEKNERQELEEKAISILRKEGVSRTAAMEQIRKALVQIGGN